VKGVAGTFTPFSAQPPAGNRAPPHKAEDREKNPWRSGIKGTRLGDPSGWGCGPVFRRGGWGKRWTRDALDGGGLSRRPSVRRPTQKSMSARFNAAWLGRPASDAMKHSGPSGRFPACSMALRFAETSRWGTEGLRNYLLPRSGTTRAFRRRRSTPWASGRQCGQFALGGWGVRKSLKGNTGLRRPAQLRKTPRRQQRPLRNH